MFVDAPPAWDEIAKSQEFQSLTPNEKANVQRRWVFDRMNYDYDRGNEINQKAMVKEFKKNGFEPTVINTGFKDFTDYRSYMEGQQAEGLQGDAREEALSPNYSFGEGLLVGSQQAAGALGAGLVRPFEGMAGVADMTVGKALEAVTGSRMGIDKLANNLHGIVADMGRGVETDVIHGFSEGGFWGGVNALTNMVLMEAPNQIIQLGIGAAGIPQPYALAMLGASSMGSEYNELKNDKSLSELQKYSIATLNGTIEGVTELMDSIPFIKRMTSSTKQAIFREFMRSKPIRTMAKEFLKTFAGEAAEEATGEFLQNVSEAAIRGEKINWKDLGIQVANAGIGGGAMGGMMGVGGVAYNRHADRNRTSRKAFQEIRALQMGFNPQAKNFNKLVDKIQLPDKFTPLEARRKAIDDYDFHGEPISFGEEVTDAERVNALKERIAWYDNIKDYIEDGKEKAEWDEYYKEWTEKLDALQNKKADNQPEQLPPPVDEEGNELGAEEVTEEEPPKEEKPAVVEKPAEEKPKEPPRWVAEHPNHEKSPGGHYEIVDANDILVSGDEGHLAIMQNRSEGTERTAQINDMSAHPNVSKMFTEGLTDEGAPIAVMRDGKLMVVSGNGRTKARRLMATRRTDMEYLNKLQQWAKDNGVEMPKGMQAPMLLRVIDENLDDEQLKDFVRQANMDGNDKLALDAAERSADDAVGMEKHGDKLIGLFTESEGDAIVSASNKEFLSKFRSLIGKRDGDVDFNGLPTSQFERRVANAFLGMLFKNMPVAERNDLLNNFINHGDKYNIVGVYRGLAKKAPKLIKLAQSNKAFALDDILPKALDALLDFKANREQFKNDPDMYLNQSMLGGMDKHELKGDERDLFKILATAKYQSQMARVLQDYVDKARLNATPDLYGETMNRGQLLQSVLAAEQARVESNGGAAVDAFLDNGSFDDSDMPTVEGERRVSDTPKKAAKRNPMLRESVENETQAAKTDAEDSFVEQISKAAKDVADGFGYKVVVHKNDADLPLSVQEDLAAFGDGTFAEAWMDNEGVVHLVASRLESSEDAIKKVLHEIVGHIGLAALFKEGRYSDAWFKMTEDLWEAHREDIKKRCAAYVNAEGFDVDSESGRANLVEEWLARLAEINRKPLWWKSIVSKVRALLRSVGLDVAWSDSDIQQLLADAATAARKVTGKTGNRYSISNLWTGSAADYGKPSLQYIGTGEGEQVFGWGLYATDNRGIAETYAEKDVEQKSTLLQRLHFNGHPFNVAFLQNSPLSNIIKAAVENSNSKEGAIEWLQNRLEQDSERGKQLDQLAISELENATVEKYDPTNRRNLYRQTWFLNRVKDGEANLLEWNEPLSQKELKRIYNNLYKTMKTSGKAYEGLKDELADLSSLYADGTGEDVYANVKAYLGTPKAASEFLYNECDIDGIRYAANSFGLGDGSDGWNYVSFSDTNMRVDEHIRYSLIGSQGAARLGRTSSLAEQMEKAGKTAEQIWAATGWERGADGKWRTETKPLKVLTSIEKNPTQNFADFLSSKKADAMPLSKLVSANELFKAYPELKDVQVTKGYESKTRGVSDLEDNLIYVNENLPISDLENVLTHEVQHLIQEIEGFAKGGASGAMAWLGTEREFAVKEYNKLLKNTMVPDSLEDYAKNAWGSDVVTEEIKEAYKQYVKDVQNPSPMLLNAIQRAAGDNAYYKLAGEVEARNAATRSPLYGRRFVRPAETESVKRDEQYIRYSVAKPVQDETSPIPQGPLPPIANIMRQRTARSPISNLRALRLPAIVMLGRKLGGNLSAVDRIKRMPSALGVFREGTREIEVIRSLVEPHQLGDQWVVPQGKEDQKAEMIKDYWAERDIPRDEIEIVMKTDEAAKEVTIKAIWHDKSQTLFKKVLGHEIGHLIDYNQGETTTHGNVLGTVGGMGYKYLQKIIGETPDNQIDFEKFEKRKKKLHKQAEGLAGEKPKDADELKAWRETVKAEYANLLTSECEQNGWFQAAVIRDELIANTEWWSGEIGLDPNYRRYRTSPTELFAEAMSVLLNAPDKFAKQLPETWRMLQNYQKERPEFHKAWQGLMRMMNNEEAYTDALMKLAEEGFTADEETEIQIEKEHHDAWRAIKRKIVDSFADVNDASKQLVREGKVTLDETPISNIVSATHQSIKDYYLILAERLSKPLFDAGLTESDIGKYLEFQRIVNDPSINQGHIINPNGMTVNDAKDALAKLKRTLGKEKWELLGKWHKDFWQLRQETIIRLAEESGMYDKALIEHMKKNEWYSYRAVVEQIYNADGTEKRGMSKIYGLKGTLSPIANPLGWTYDHDMRLMGGILWNQARLKTIQFMKEQFPDLVNKVKKFGVVSNHAPDGFARLAVLENGQYVEYDVAETWAKGFQSQLDRDTAVILEKAQWITNLYRRAWTTLSPTFLLNNVVRDYLASYQNLSGINRQIGMVEWTKCWMQGMKEAFKFQFKGESELIEGMMKSNMFQSGGKGYDMSGRSGELAGSRRMELLRRYGMAKDEQIRRGAIARFTKYLSDHLGITWLGDKLGKAVSATEMGAKAGGLLALQRNGEFTDAEKQWHVVRHIGSPDFAQRGTATPIWNTLFIFSNAAIQGWNRTLEMAKANPKGFAARFMATTGTAVFIQWALESGALLAAVKGVMGDDDDEAKGLVALLEWIQKQYGRITHHNRYNYMCLPIAETDDGHCLAFRMPFAENSKLPAMMLHAALDEAYTKIKKDENFKTETGKAIANQAPNLNPVLGMSGDAFLMYVCGVNGYDKYRQRRAVRTKDWEAGGWRRFKGTTAYMIHEYTPFAIVNNMFDLRDNPYWWWNLIGALGPGAWFKFQQYGEAEQSRAVTAEKRRKKLNGKASAFYR